MRMLRTVLLVTVALGAPACKTRNGGTTAIIATVKTLDDGIAEFTKWAVAEESRLADKAIASCSDKTERNAYNACVNATVGEKRSKIDAVRLAIRLYGDALDAARGVRTDDLTVASKSLLDALAAIGFVIGGTK